MSKHYIIRLRDTELWVNQGMEYGHGGAQYYPKLKTDPLRVQRYDTFEEAEKFAEKHIPEGHWVIHRLTPKTELTEKPLSETFVVSEAAPAPTKEEERAVNCGRLCTDKKHWWCRFFHCG